MKAVYYLTLSKLMQDRQKFPYRDLDLDKTPWILGRLTPQLAVFLTPADRVKYCRPTSLRPNLESCLQSC